MTDKTRTAPLSVIEHIAQQWDGCTYESVGEDIDIGESIRAAAKNFASIPDVVGGDVVDILRAVRENGYACYLAGGGDRDGFQTKIDAVLADPRVQGDAEWQKAVIEQAVITECVSIEGRSAADILRDIIAWHVHIDRAAQPKGDNKRVYAVPADSTSDSGHQLYTIHDESVPMADNWCLIDALSHPAEQTRGEPSATHSDPFADLAKGIEVTKGKGEWRS